MHFFLICLARLSLAIGNTYHYWQLSRHLQPRSQWQGTPELTIQPLRKPVCSFSALLSLLDRLAYCINIQLIQHITHNLATSISILLLLVSR